MWEDSEKEDRTIVNHFHGVSSPEDDVLKLTTPRLSPRNRQKFSGGFRGVSVLEPQVTESAEFYAVSDEIHRWSSVPGDVTRSSGVKVKHFSPNSTV